MENSFGRVSTGARRGVYKEMWDEQVGGFLPDDNGIEDR